MKKMSLLAVLLAFVLSFALVGCGNNNDSNDSGSTDTPGTEAPATEDQDEDKDEPAEAPEGDGSIVLGRSYSAPHGEKSFAQVDVIMSGDTIVAVNIDEFQFSAAESYTGVPNADSDFGAEGFADQAMTLISKMENSEAYSAGMAEKAGSTVTFDKNIQAIIDFAVGKTVAELEDALKDAVAGSPMDAISGSTLVDTSGYLTSIKDAAKSPQITTEIAFDGNVSDLKLGYALYAAHGTKAFASTSVVVDGDSVVAALVDEFQVVAAADYDGVPNTDAGFGEGIVADKVLASKRLNSDKYSEGMTANAGATMKYGENILAIEEFAAGKTFAELEGLGADAISGSTLVDAAGYAQSIAEAAKAAK